MIKDLIVTFFIKDAQGFVQFFRYGVVSGLAFVIDVGLLYWLSEIMGVHYIPSASIAFLVGVTIVYLGSIFWVFPKRSGLGPKKEAVAFLLIGLVGLLLTDLLLFAMIEWINQTVLFAKIYATVLVFLFNFTARKFLLFK